MAFPDIIAMISGQRQFFLYVFQRRISGSNPETYNFTSLPEDHWGLSRLFTSIAISHDKLTSSSDTARIEARITFPINNEFAQSFFGGLSYDPVSVTIYHGFFLDDVQIIYTGNVIGYEASEEGTIVLQCMTRIHELARKGLNAVIQRPCRHSLYGYGCNVNIASFQISGSVTAISANGKVITVSTADLQPNGYYKGGILTLPGSIIGDFSGRREMILDHVGENLTIAAKIPNLIIGNTVDISAGCNLTTSMCLSRFNNLNNFGGFPYILDTPFDGRSIV